MATDRVVVLVVPAMKAWIGEATAMIGVRTMRRPVTGAAEKRAPAFARISAAIAMAHHAGATTLVAIAMAHRAGRAIHAPLAILARADAMATPTRRGAIAMAVRVVRGAATTARRRA